MIVAARYPYDVNKRIKYHRGIKRYPYKEDVFIFKKIPASLQMKILSYLSNPEVDKKKIHVTKKRYDYMNSEIIINSPDLEKFQVLQYKWCKYCGERSTSFTIGYNCDCDL